MTANELLDEFQSSDSQHALEESYPVDADDFVDLWNRSSVMHFAEFEATGRLWIGEDITFADLWMRYIHDDSGDNDRDVQVAVFRVDEGAVWVVMDLLVDPDTGEQFGDPKLLRERAKLALEAEPQSIDTMMGFG